MLSIATAFRLGCERLLAPHVVELSTSLRSYDAADLIALAHLERYDALRSILQADCAAYFKPDVMSFGDIARVRAEWNKPPTIQLSMEFRHAGVEIYYRLTLRDAEAGIEIDFIHVEDEPESESRALQIIGSALSDARLVPIRHI